LNDGQCHLPDGTLHRIVAATRARPGCGNSSATWAAGAKSGPAPREGKHPARRRSSRKIWSRCWGPPVFSAGKNCATQLPARCGHRLGLDRERRRSPVRRGDPLAGRKGLTITGQIGEVMQESAKAAQSYIWSHAKELGISPEGLQGRRYTHPRPRRRGIPRTAHRRCYDGHRDGLALHGGSHPQRYGHDRRTHPHRPGCCPSAG